MKQIFYTFFNLLSSKEKRGAGTLLLLILIVAIFDAAGVASIMPFIALLVNPELMETNPFLSAGFDYAYHFGIQTKNQYLFTIGFCVFLILISSLILKAWVTLTQTSFAYNWEYKISKSLVEKYLGQPYEWFLKNHGADLNKNILSDVSIVVMHCFIPLLTITMQGAVSLAVLILLFFVNFKLSLGIGIVLGIIYGSIYVLSAKYLRRLGKQHFDANRGRYRVSNEAFNATKEIKLLNLEANYIRRFNKHALETAKHQTSATIVGQLPRFALEGLIFGGMLSVILYLMTSSGGFISALPTISVFAFAGYRLMPALQQIYSASTQIRFVKHPIGTLVEDLKLLNNSSFLDDEVSKPSPIKFNKDLVLKNISFKYDRAEREIFSNLSLRIEQKTSVGIIGTTGSGKTTLVDLILCLLKAQLGTLEIDGKVVTEANEKQWQRLIGYVPQQIFLSDASIAANIAFGEEQKNINQKALIKASKIAQLHSFVVEQLPQKYDTTIGENGARLSGGQRQRIGIARALYRNPKILIFDEATSALDNNTEKAVVDAVQALKNEITTIQISHRLNTVKNCDKIFQVKDGIVKEIYDPTYDEK